MPIHVSSFRIVFAALLFLCSCQELTQQNALPLASLPLPENDDHKITVSTPDEIGYVTVSGSNSIIPTDHALIVTINLPDSVDPESNCMEDIPLCPTLNLEHQCRFEKQTAQTDFQFQLPASIDDTLLFTFRNISTCEEEDVAEVIIDADDTKAAVESPTLLLPSSEGKIEPPIDEPVVSESKLNLNRIDTYDDILFHHDFESYSVIIAAVYPDKNWNNLYFGLIVQDTDKKNLEIVKRVELCQSPGELTYRLMPLKQKLNNKPILQIHCEESDEVLVLDLSTLELIRRIPFEQSLFNQF